MSDRVIEPDSAYAVFGILGIMGLLLGYWRRWLGAIWLVLTLGYATLWIDQVKWLYSNFEYYDFRSFLLNDFTQLHLAILLGVGLNLAGLFIKKLKTQLS